MENSKTKISVLGCGMVGGFIARKLAEDSGFAVTAFDASEKTLGNLHNAAAEIGCEKNLTLLCSDLSGESAIRDAVSDCDIAIGALPGYTGYAALKTVIESGKNCVDISFFPEDSLSLDEMARSNGVTAIVDCGVMPGFGGMVAVHLAGMLDICESVKIYVGGLPVERGGVFEYKAPFSPSDVIEEYLRPARMRVCGKSVVKPALSEIERLHFFEIGNLEAFNTDGLRTLLTSLPDVPNLAEKTLRYPGHVAKVEILRDLGLLSDKPMAVTTADGNPVQITPLEITSRLLFAEWRLWDDDLELTVMRVVAEGTKDGGPAVFEMNLLDRTDEKTWDTSMARTTGLPVVAAVKMLADESVRDGLLKDPSIFPAELFGKDEKLFDRIMHFLIDNRVGVEFAYHTTD